MEQSLMAFNPNPQTAVQQPSWKNDAFLNVWLTLPDGSKMKIGETGIGLKKSRRTDAALIERLQTGGPEALAAMAKVISFDFRLVDDPKAEPVKLGF
jgi:hypothetical protein